MEIVDFAIDLFDLYFLKILHKKYALPLNNLSFFNLYLKIKLI